MFRATFYGSGSHYLGAVAQATSRIKRRTMSTVMLHFNNPIRTAERLATMDIISRSRIEFGTARGNNAVVVRTFHIDAENSKAEWRETLIYLSATSIATHATAGKLGIGAMHASPYGWDYLRDSIQAYKKELCVVRVHCTATREKAPEESHPATFGFAKLFMPFYHAIGETSPDYAYPAEVKNTLGDHAYDLPYLVDALPWFLIGTP